MSFFEGKLIPLRVLGFAVLICAGSQAKGNGPAFLVSVSNASPRLSEMLEITTEPFGTTVITATNAGIISTNAAPWSGMAFSPGGTLYGITLGSELAAIDPTTAAYSVFSNLHLTASASGVENLVSGASLAFSTNGSGYVSDGVNLYTANFASGLCSYVGTFPQVGQGGCLAEAPDGTMFGLFLNLYTVNLTNAQVTQIGPASSFGSGNNPIFALSAAFGSDSNLYMVGWDNAKADHPMLYLVLTNDGAAIALGSLPFGSHGLVALNSANPDAPTIVFPPANQAVMAGQTATFSVSGRGTPTPAAQWYFEGAAAPNATNSTLTFTNVSPTNAGAYFVILSNTNGTATSEVVTLTVTAPILASTGSTGDFTNSILALTTNPPTETVLLKSNAFFSNLSFGPRGGLFAMAERSITNGTAPPGDTNAQAVSLYSVNTQTWTTNFIGDVQTNEVNAQSTPVGMAFSPSGVLYASFDGSLYTVDSTTAQASKVGNFPTGIVIGGIAFTTGGTLYGGETNLYTINLTNASVTKVGALNGAGASILADMKYGADGFLYFCDGALDGNLYRLNPANAQVAVAANYPVALFGLAFVPIPTVLEAEPSNQVVVTGTAAVFSVTATGTVPLNYQWYFDKAPIQGATNSLLNIATALAKNNGTYYVVVSNSLGPVTSSVVTLTTYTPSMITRPPKAEVITAGQTIALSVEATGTTLQYQWQLDGTNLPGKTAAGLTIRDAQAADAGTYTVLVSVPFVAMPSSASASVGVLPATPVISSPANHSVTGQGNLSITGREADNGGVDTIMYQLNGGAPTSADVSSNGLTWSAAVALVPGTNVFLVWATNASGASAIVKASFIFNPFIPVAGGYYGLFSDDVSPAFTNAGYFNLTLESDRVFSGDILLDGTKTSFTGRFDTNGAAALVASNAPRRDFAMTLQLDLSGVNPLTGSISNTTQAWSASVNAVRAGFGGTLPATNYEGNYVLAISNANNAAAAPPGYSYALARIGPTGGVTLSGTMADGAVFTSTGTGISQSGDWPLYGSLFSGKGSVLAWIKFPQHSAQSQMTSGQALWFETSGADSHYYTNGFNLLTNQLSLIVNRYLAPPKGTAVLPSVNYTVQLFGGNLGASLSNNITINANNVVAVAGPNSDKLSITINAAAGTISGSFVSPVTSTTAALKGVLLPDNNAALGFFLGPNEGGGILIQP
ncbi:MAG TPA: immunoglobulin domain-containing protein [Verrucomicrobiae bacterium]|nr:immunoglobulin domain-containing protein [Verrucomicrobiae bacterium]